MELKSLKLEFPGFNQRENNLGCSGTYLKIRCLERQRLFIGEIFETKLFPFIDTHSSKGKADFFSPWPFPQNKQKEICIEHLNSNDSLRQG